MIDRNDLKAAVGAGIVTERQAAALASLSDSRRGAREGLAEGDEPFELFKGFNEIFIVVGLLILTAGWAGIVGLTSVSEITNPRYVAPQYGLTGAAVIWALSEYFIRRRRMVAPAITLSILFAINAAIWLTAYFAEPFMVAQEDYSSLPWPFAVGTGALILYWLRFRVPFALAMIAIGLFIVAILVAATSQGTPDSLSDLFLLSAAGPFAWITLALGVGVFCIAMVFDMSDPHRVTRRSSNGFWLHIVAAPALVNTIALSLLEQDTTTANGILIVFLTVFALIAMIIDRRSFLIAAVGYIMVLTAAVLDNDGTALSVLILGVVLLGLGAFWDRIRAALLMALPFLPKDRLPPSFSMERPT